MTGGVVSTGIYSASVAFTGSSTMSKLFDVWFTGSLHVSSAVEATLQFHTGSIDVEKFEGSSFSDSSKYFINFTNLLFCINSCYVYLQTFT